MLASITPLGERSRGSRWGLTAAWFAAGAVGAGLLVGAALGAGGMLLPTGRVWRAVAAAGVIGVSVLFDGTPLRRRLPSSRRQVNEDWLLRYRGWVYGVAFGAQLGTGVATIITTATVYAAGLLCLLTSAPGAGAAIGGTFGAIRALSLLAGGRVRDPLSLSSFHRRMAAMEVPVFRVILVAELLALLIVGTGWLA